ncbi:MAG TPA: cyclic nucleotide-binding domain-containing protein [Gaiellaceae bacterium]|nr:cyclic nucleotide-binding domain-containing protein [Gaiellaceae bacterium]
MAEAPIELLRGVPLFADLKPKELKHIAEAMTERRVEPGQDIAVEGKQGVGFFVIESGTARVTIAGESKRILGPGDYFGEIALIVDTPRTATVTAETPLHCWGIARWVFRPLVQDNPTVAWHLLDSLAKLIAER